MISIRFAWLLLSAWSIASAAKAGDPTAPIDFAREIRPLLAKHCLACHGVDPSTRKQDLRLDEFEFATALRDSGRAIAPGEPQHSSILTRLRHPDDEERMPPANSGSRLAPSEIDKLERWIEQGAQYTEHWAFRAPTKQVAPNTRFDSLALAKLDRFVFAELERHGLEPAPAADRITWLRRASLDLTGLPPTLAEARAFESDASPVAFESVVDRLLASPAYGERMARLWLDLARYADSAGYGSDPLRTIWRYRDYVIDAFDANRRYDEFVIEQLAGDLLPRPTEDQLLATAFHRNTLTNTEGGTDDEEFRVAAVKDRTNVTLQAFMGLTFGCAQCHSHKFDPISHDDYYRMFSFFDQTEDSDRADESPQLETARRENRAAAEQLTREITETEQLLETRKHALALDEDPTLELLLRSLRQRLANLRALPVESAVANASTELSIAGDRVTTDVLAEHATYRIGFAKPSAPVTALAITTHPRAGVANPNFVLNEIRVNQVRERAEPPRARFVRIELSGADRILSLAEVAVESNGVNVAPQGRASQSSTAYDGPADRAIDGRTDGTFDQGSVTHTAIESDPWWELDFAQERVLDRIVLANRTDGALERRLDGATIRMLNASRQEVARHALGAATDAILPLDFRHEITPIEIIRASADFEQDGFPAHAVLDRDSSPRNGFAVAPRQGQSHRLVLELATAIDESFEVVIDQNYGENHVLADFSFACGSECDGPYRARTDSLAAAIDSPVSQRSDSDRVALVELVTPHLPQLAALAARLAELRSQRDALGTISTPILRELPLAARRTSYVLAKGNFLDRLHPVTPGVPEKLHPWPASAPLDRLGLARWITARENPLFARVFVNRMWAMLFGRGLVFTEEDFGIQGAPPENQPLLDALAVDFAGAGYDIKHLLRTLVLSYAYRQSSAVTPRVLAIDPDNKWIGRGPRHRVDAEIVRDQALAVAGLLSDKRYGPPVYPPQPDGLWRAAFNGERSYETSAGDDRHRRALYTVWRRTVPYPSLATFDAPSRETCALRRTRTNTPLQAFITLNDPAFVECAQGLARRILRECAGDDASRASHGLRLTLLAAPDPRQVAELVALVRGEREHFAKLRVDARALATDPFGPLPEGVDEVEAAAWTVVANVLLNQDAFLTKG